MPILLGVFVLSGLLLVGLSVPLIYRQIATNPLYGFRVRQTLTNEKVWYDVNEYAARRLFWVGVATVISALAFFFVFENVGLYASAVAAVVLLGLAVNLVQSFRYLFSLERE